MVEIIIKKHTCAGADAGEVKRVNFHPPFSEPPSFIFFLIPQILIGSKAPSISRKVVSGRRVTRLPELPWASQLFIHFLTKLGEPLI